VPSPFRRTLARLHRWVGLASGLIVFVVGLAGAIYVWEAELFALVHRDAVRVAPATGRLDADSLVALAQRALPAERRIGRLTLHADRSRAAVASAQRTVPGAATHFGEYAWFDEVYLDPADGRVLAVIDRKHDPIYLTRVVHTSLLLGQAGTRIVATATLLFVAMALTGLALWWPRTRALLGMRLRPRLTGPWKRSVFDGHYILGVYGLGLLLLFALTGPVWTWRWYEAGIVWLLTGTAKLEGEPVPTPATPPPGAVAAHPMERALRHVQQQVPDARRWFVEVPSPTAKSGRVLTVGVVYDRASLWEEYERYYFDPVTAELLGDERFDEKNLGMKWRNSNYGIHTGTLFGWPMQVVASLTSLLAASLPVTGALIWFPRWRRRRGA
jgi:uncharacterized iron-regulated membrane protein